MSDTNRDAVERTLEILVFAPIGAGLYLLDAAPPFLNMLAARGRAEVERRHADVQQRVTTARSMGQVVLAFGLPVLKNRMRERVEDVLRPAESPPVSSEGHVSEDRAAPAPPGTTPAPEPAPAAQPWVAAVDAPARDDLPIPGYDTLSASQVVARLTGLAPSELDAVHAYETAHRQRRTILGKIEQLAG